MKNICKKCVSLILVIALLLPIFANTKSYADSSEYNSTETLLSDILSRSELIYDEDLNISFYKVDNLTAKEIQTLSVKGIAIFVLSVLVGYIVDGAIIYITGNSASWWVSEAMKWANSNVKKLFIQKDGSSYGVNSSGCIKKVPHGNWICPYSL